MALGNKRLEQYEPVVKNNQGAASNYPAWFAKGTATTSGGSTSSSVKLGTDGIGVYTGTGAPTISATQGSLYLNKAGNSTSTRLFVNSDGGTTWVAVTTAS